MLEFSKNCRNTSGSLWNYCRDEPSIPLSFNSETFKYKTSITGNNYEGDDNAGIVGKYKTEIVIPLKHLSNFWRALNITLINSGIELILTWLKNWVLADMTVRAAGNNNDPPAIVPPNKLEFQITDTKVHVPVVTLSRESNKKFLEQLNSRFEITVKWNKFRSKVITQPQNNSLNYLNDPIFTKVKRWLVLAVERIE